MALSIITAVRNDMLDLLTTELGTSPVLRIYDGAAPADANTALSGNATLVTLPCSTAFAAAAASGQLTANTISSAVATGTGTATFYRLLTSGGTCVAQGEIADLNLLTTAITIGLTVEITSWVFTQGDS